MKKFGVVAAIVILTISSVGCQSGPIGRWFGGGHCDTCNQAPPSSGCFNGQCGIHDHGMYSGGTIGTPVETGTWNSGFVPGGQGVTNPGPGNGN